MKKLYPTKNLLLVLTIFGFASLAQAKEETHYSIETDPATFAWQGYALHLRTSPANMKNWIFGAGAYSMTFPDFLVNMNSANKDKGWELDLQQGFGFFSEYSFNQNKKGWLVGSQLATHNFRVSKGENSSDYTNGLLMLYGGYRWFPYDDHLYIQPWAGLGYTKIMSGNAKVGADEFDVDPLTMFATVHLGYTF